MLKTKEIESLFSDFCHEWGYFIEFYDERISMLLLKHKKYSDFKDSYINVDFLYRVVRVYSTLENDTNNLYSDILSFDEMSDLYKVINSIFNKLDFDD